LLQGLVEMGGKQKYLRNSMSKHRLRQLAIYTIILVLAVWLSANTCHHFNRTKIDTRGKMLTRSAWPETFVEFLKDVDKNHIHVKQFEAYHGLHDDYFLKCEFTPELLNLMMVRWKLSAVNKNHKLVYIVLENLPSALSSLNQGDDIDYYVSAECLPGGEWKGHLYCVMNDKTNKVIIVRYYYNF
jgi:hypothetical protein